MRDVAVCPSCGEPLLAYTRPSDGELYQGCPECLSWPPFSDEVDLDGVEPLRAD